MTKHFESFKFENYSFDYNSGKLLLNYRYDKDHTYQEIVRFDTSNFNDNDENRAIIDAIAFYVFVVAGTSYYKIYAPSRIEFEEHQLDGWQAGFFNMLYKGGLSQFIYENQLHPDSLASFPVSHAVHNQMQHNYSGKGILLMQSGGKDSLLSAEILRLNDKDFTSWHMSSTGKYPEVLDAVGAPIIVSQRSLDLEAIKRDEAKGGMNGHIPFSALYAGFALLQAVLSGKNIVLASNEASADEGNITVDGYEINHQYSKTFKVELAIQEYIHRYISEDLHYVSLLRPFHELRVGELFAKYAWPKYKHQFSSCNLANYKQGKDGGALQWDGICPKCANTFLLLAPFVEPQDLLAIFSGKNLLQDDELVETYKQLFGFSEIKPFECVGTFDEMRYAYQLACEKDAIYKQQKLEVSDAEFEYDKLSHHQPIADTLVNYFAL